MVECLLAKEEVASSNLVFRSSEFSRAPDPVSGGDVAKWQGRGLQNPYAAVRIRSSPPISKYRYPFLLCVVSDFPDLGRCLILTTSVTTTASRTMPMKDPTTMYPGTVGTGVMGTGGSVTDEGGWVVVGLGAGEG